MFDSSNLRHKDRKTALAARNSVTLGNQMKSWAAIIIPSFCPGDVQLFLPIN